MSCESVFKLDATLEKLSSIAVAIQFWNHPDVQDMVKHYSKEIEFSGFGEYFLVTLKKWLKIVNYVTNRVNLPKFPEKLLREVRCYIPVIGEKIFNWIQYVIEERKLNIQYAWKIYWTPYGLIDKEKIVEEYWLKESQLLTLRDNDYLNEPSITIAVLYARENFIRDNMEKMKDRLLPEDKRQQHWTVYGLLSAWVIFYTKKNNYNARYFLKDCKKHNDLPAKPVFDECVKNNYKFAAEYFWDKLTFNEKETCVAEAAESCLDSLYESIDSAGYLEENKIELLVFLLNQMSPGQLREFVSKNCLSLMQFFLSTWPYQEFCVNLLNESWDHNPKDIKELLILTMKYLSCQLKNKSVYRLVFEKLLKKTSKEIKEIFFVKKNKNAFFHLYESLDVFSLSLILNDPDLKEHRIKLISNFEDILKGLVVSGNLYDLNRLMDNASSEEEKNLFKRKSDCLASFVTAGKFEFADDHIKWLYDSESERSAAKERLDALKICFQFVYKYKFDLADEFLNWMFDAEEKKRSVKNSLNKSDEFLWSEIIKIWSSEKSSRSISDDHIEAKCSEMLKWFLESDEAVAEFKKTKLTDEFFVVKYWKNLCNRQTYCYFDEFLEFCLWTPEEVKNYKEKIKSNADWWIDTFGRDDFEMVYSLLFWAFQDYPSIKQIIRNYMSSPRGILLCVGVFKNYDLSKDRVKEFFDSDWVEPLIDMNPMEIKMTLDSFDEIIMWDGLKSCILKLLALKKADYSLRPVDFPEDISPVNERDESSDDKYCDFFSNYNPELYGYTEDGKYFGDD